MKQKLFLLTLFSLFVGILSSFAQNTLNIHQKNGAVVSYGFSENPVVTYTNTGVHLATTTVEIDYPFDNLEKFTFVDGIASGIEQLLTEGTNDDIRIYDLRGVLVKTVKQNGGTASFSTANLPKGIYVIKNGKTTYKITKR